MEARSPCFARARMVADKPGCTVVIVNFNTRKFVEVAVEAVRRFAGGAPHCPRQPLPRRIHSLGFEPLATSPPSPCAPTWGTVSPWTSASTVLRTETVIALDVDAFPISDEWLPTLMSRLNEGVRDGSIATVAIWYFKRALA